MYLTRFAAVLVTAFLLITSREAVSAVITFDGPGDVQGTGVGNTLFMLSLQQNPEQWGTILPEGAPTSPPTSNHELPFSTTRSVAELTPHGIGADNFTIVLNINQPFAAPRRTIQLRNITLRFYTDPNDLGQFFDATFTAADPGLTLEPVGTPGTGTSGWFFPVEFSGSEAAAFFDDPANRIGMFIPSDDPMSNAFGGPDTFFIIPEPAILPAFCLLTFLVGRRRPAPHR